MTDLQPDQTEYPVDTDTELPLTHQANPKRDLELLTGPTPQRQVDSDQGLQPDPTATEVTILPVPSGPGKPRKGLITTKDNDRSKSTTPSGAADLDLPNAVPILTPAQLQSIAKRRRQKSRANPPKNPTACFYLSTLMLKWTAGGAIWMPIYKAARGDIVIQSLPSGNIADLSGALMAKIETVCTFGCSKDRIDIVKYRH